MINKNILEAKMKYLYRLIYTFLLMGCLLIIGCAYIQKHSVENINIQQDITEIAIDIMKRHNIPAMVFAVVSKDEIIVQKALGHRIITEINEEPTIDINDYFHLGSNGKAIAGFIAAYFVEQGKISWDTKFFELFPELIESSNPDYLEITLVDLFSHRAGVKQYNNFEDFMNRPEFTGNIQERRKHFVEYVLTLPKIENEKNWNYSNAGYSIAGVMLERVSSQSWEELSRDVLTEKADIEFVFGWPNRNFENQPYGHSMATDSEGNKYFTQIPASTSYDLALFEPAGDFSMNLKNYIRFIQMNLKGLSGKDNFLSSETYNYLFKAKDDYAIGWLNIIRDGTPISTHSGSDGTFYATVYINRDTLTAYIILANTGTLGVYELSRKLREIYK